MLATTALTGLLALSALSLAASAPSTPSKASPNVVFIIVDDQDARQNSVGTMEAVQRLLVDEGTTFSRFFAPISGSSFSFPISLLVKTH